MQNDRLSDDDRARPPGATRTIRAALALAVLLALPLTTTGCIALSIPVDDSATSGAEAPETMEDADFGTVEIYEVGDDGDLTPAPAAGSLTAEVWEDFGRVVSPDAASTISEYLVGDAPDADTLAYVAQSDKGSSWVFGVNLATSSDRSELIPTLIHEYAHLLALDDDELIKASACPTVDLDEGCLTPESSLWEYQERFWSPYGEDAPPPHNDDADVADAFYADHEDDFVSAYAATNVVEDFAESFMTFVIEDRPETSTPIAQKIAFFYENSAYVADRERIRAEFADALGITP